MRKGGHRAPSKNHADRRTSPAGAWITLATFRPHAEDWIPVPIVLRLNLPAPPAVIVTSAPVIVDPAVTIAIPVTAIVTPAVAIPPAITVTVERPVAVVVVPVAADAERHCRNAQRTVILRTDAHAALRIRSLQIGAGNPASITSERHIAPVGARHASLNVHATACRHHDDRRVPRAWPGPHVDIGG